MSLLSLFGMEAKRPNVDFNYPKDVAKTALTDADKALKTHNGEAVVDAMVRYGIAQSLISEENIGDIVGHIEQSIKREQKPEIKALLRYFEALVFNSYCDNYINYSRRNAEDDRPPKDYAQWSRSQMQKKVDELIMQALERPDALGSVSVTDMPDIITCDKQGATLVPTLREFLYNQCSELTKNSALESILRNQWVQSTQGNVPAHLYAQTRSGRTSLEELYEQYADNEHSGIILSELSHRSHYKQLKEYVERFPNSFYAPQIRNIVSELEERSLTARYPERLNSTQPIEVKLVSDNVNRYTLNVYRLSDEQIANYRNSRNNNAMSIPLSELSAPVVQQSGTIEGTIPFDYKEVMDTLAPLPYGVYVIVPSYEVEGKMQTVSKVSCYNLLVVSDIAVFSVDEADQIKTARVLTIDPLTGKPLSGVRLQSDQGKWITDGDGTAIIDKFHPIKDNSELTPIKGEDRFGFPYSAHHGSPSYDPMYTSAKLFTDLGIYRPGETVKWSAVVYSTTTDTRQTMADAEMVVRLYDHNGREITSDNCTTDDYGRVSGEFVLPTDRMNGRFRLTIGYRNSSSVISSRYIDVSEYKTPTFTITFDDSRDCYVKGEPVKIEGLVQTYSGMPVADTEVTATLKRSAWFWHWWNREDDDSNDVTTLQLTTDKRGRFTAELPANLFPESKSNYVHYRYCFHALCTTAAGETQEADHHFIVGDRKGISLAGKITHINNKPLTLPLTYNTTMENAPAVTCTYELQPKNSNKAIATGTFSTDRPVVDLTAVPSGVYTLTVRMNDASDDDDSYASAEVVLYKPGDKTAPVDNCPMWMPLAMNHVDSRNVAHITIGTSVPQAHIYYVAETRTGLFKQGWLHYSPGIHDFTLPVPTEREQYLHVTFYSTYDRTMYSEDVRLQCPSNIDKLQLRVETFRDRLVPGSTEHWKLQAVDKDGKPRQAALMLEMIDKAINSLTDNRWQFSVGMRSRSFSSINHATIYGTSSHSLSWRKDAENVPNWHIPELYLYNNRLFGSRAYDARMLDRALGGAMPLYRKTEEADYREERLAPMPVFSAAMSNEEATEDAGDSQPLPDDPLKDVSLRMADVKTALWMPMLTTDDKGNVAIEFDVPDFNTTWLVQAIGWDSDLYTDRLEREVLTQKPVMVRASLPRFLRHADRATLAANVQNATDQPIDATAVVELFDPRSGEVFTRQTFTEHIAGKGTNVVRLDWTVPADIAFVGFRVKAATGLSSDGEQVMVPVLENSQPVIETTPFFADAGTQEVNVTVPQTADNARITLEYCDNPVWYCVTALPTIFSDSRSTTSNLAHSLFAIELAQGIAGKYPQAQKAIEYWKTHAGDSAALTSMLAQNPDLKIVDLLASPWINESDRQSLRMRQLDRLFDPEAMDTERNEIIEQLNQRQLSDGGWPWFTYPGCTSSVWTTSEVLEMVGKARHLGFLHHNDQLNQIIRKAVEYLDAEYLNIYNNYTDNKKNFGPFMSYAFVRTFFNDVALPKANKKLVNNTIKWMAKNWKNGLTVSDKAFYALALQRNGKHKDAVKIVESIRQFALVKPELGMYWDNLGTYYNKVAVTAVILQAINEIDAHPGEVDQVRKYILLNKQTNDWGSSSLAADAVYTILSLGTDWLVEGMIPQITLDNEPITVDEGIKYLGYFRQSIDAKPGATLRLQRQAASPAWGSLYCQYVAKMANIEEVAIKELAISKEYYRVDPDGTLHRTDTFRVGDKVEVHLSITCNRDMEFVALDDQRAACLEPVDQHSGYRYNDGAYYYLETKDAATRLFFTRLLKGTHVVGYQAYVMAPGTFSAGIAAVQCQYAPQMAAHSAGSLIVASPQADTSSDN